MRRWMAWVAVSAGCAWAAAPAKDAAEPADPGLVQLERTWREIDAEAPGYGVRGIFDFALEACVRGWHPERVERAFEVAEKRQDRDPKSATYGNFAWYLRDAKPDDRNAVEFCMERAALIWLHHRQRLTPAAAERLERMTRFAVEGIRLHKVRVSYTNIFLMKLWNCIALGEATGRLDLAKEGYAMLDEWLAFTAKAGITEYLSPTYYAVDLGDLGAVALNARDAAGRQKAALALRLFWTDIAVHWFEPAGRVGGAHGRDYNHLLGQGMLDTLVQRAGWEPSPAPAETNEWMRRTWVAPPADLRALIDRPAPRVVRHRWGEAPWETAALYRGTEVALGTAGACAGPEDRFLSALLPGGPDVAGILFFMDARDDAYASRKFVTGGGHMKAHHPTPFVTSVQRGPEALLLVSGGPERDTMRHVHTNATCLRAHFVIPAEATLYAGASGGPLKLEGRMRLPSADTAVFARLKSAAVAMRYVAASDTAGHPAPVELAADGGRARAVRMTALLSETAPTNRAVAAVWMRVAEQLDEAGFDRFRRSFAEGSPSVTHAGNRVDIAVPGFDGHLRLVADLAKRERVAREGAEAGADDCMLKVDGREIGRPILERALAVDRP